MKRGIYYGTQNCIGLRQYDLPLYPAEAWGGSDGIHPSGLRRKEYPRWCGAVRDASGVTVRELTEHCEIVSLNGTVSAQRCHIHIALSREDLSTIGGHLCPGCIINTTCELVIGELPGIGFGVEQDPETGYDELIFENT